MPRAHSLQYWLAFVLTYGTPMVFIQTVDYLLGRQVTVWSLLLFPVGLATWNRGLREGALGGVMAVALVLADAIVVGGPFEAKSYALIATMNLCVAIAIVVVLVGKLRAASIHRALRKAPKLDDRRA